MDPVDPSPLPSPPSPDGDLPQAGGATLSIFEIVLTHGDGVWIAQAWRGAAFVGQGEGATGEEATAKAKRRTLAHFAGCPIHRPLPPEVDALFSPPRIA